MATRPSTSKEPDQVRIFVFLHVAAMFTAVAFSLGPTFVLRRIGASGDVPAIRRSFALSAPLIRAIPMLFGLGALLGIVAIFTNGFNPFQPFLLVAYGLFILASVVGAVITSPWFKKVTELAAASPDAAPSPELLAALDDPRARFTDWFDPIIILAFLFDMIVKPFG
jgi:hypothetical protein